MADRLTDSELKRVVAEVERISRRQEAELDRQQVEAILKDLGLPANLLDEALIQLRRQDALTVQTRQRRWITLGITFVCITGLILSLSWYQKRQQALRSVGVVQDRVTLMPQEEAITTINRANNPEVFYQVTLTDAPVGRQLLLTCDWVNPSGQIIHQNQYRTQSITTPVWQTYCRYQFGTADLPGSWTVNMRLEDRRLESAVFEVE